MNKLDLIITDELVFPHGEYGKPVKYQDRITVKAIINNYEDKIAFVTNPVHGLFLLPGGGADSNDLFSEIKRECAEEIRWSVDDLKELVSVEEFRNREAKHYTSYCFTGKAVIELKVDARTKEEKENGLEVVWLSKDEAINKLKSQLNLLEDGQIKFYNTGFNVLRDYLFLSEYLNK